MSYILDALKKADALRGQQSVPGLSSQMPMVSLTSGPKTRRTGIVLGVLATALAVAAAVWWLRLPVAGTGAVSPAPPAPVAIAPPTAPAAGAAPAQPPAAATAPGMAAPAPATPPPATVPAPVAPSPSAAPSGPSSAPAPAPAPPATAPVTASLTDAPAAQPRSARQPVRASDSAREPGAQARRPDPRQKAREQGQSPPEETSATPPRPKPGPANRPDDSTTGAEGAVAREPAAGKPARGNATPTPTERIPSLAELGEDFKRELPAMKLGGSVWSTNPSQRIVVINTQVYHEGEKPAADLVLEQIRATTAVFNFRGTRFTLPL